MKLYIDTVHLDYYKNSKVAYEGDAGIDLYFPQDVTVSQQSSVMIDFEIRCKMVDTYETPVNYYLYPRSSISKTPLRMSNSVGIIDSMYRHNIKVSVDNISNKDYIIKKGSRLFQICSPFLLPITVCIKNLSSTDRGEGFGSSGI